MLPQKAPLNSSQSVTLQVKSTILVKQTDWCYILGSLIPVLLHNSYKIIQMIKSIYENPILQVMGIFFIQPVVFGVWLI